MDGNDKTDPRLTPVVDRFIRAMIVRIFGETVRTAALLQPKGRAFYSGDRTKTGGALAHRQWKKRRAAGLDR